MKYFPDPVDLVNPVHVILLRASEMVLPVDAELGLRGPKEEEQLFN